VRLSLSLSLSHFPISVERACPLQSFSRRGAEAEGPNQKALRDQLRAPKQTRHRATTACGYPSGRSAPPPHRHRSLSAPLWDGMGGKTSSLCVVIRPPPHIHPEPNAFSLRSVYFRIVKRVDPPSWGCRAVFRGCGLGLVQAVRMRDSFLRCFLATQNIIFEHWLHLAHTIFQSYTTQINLLLPSPFFIIVFWDTSNLTKLWTVL